MLVQLATDQIIQHEVKPRLLLKGPFLLWKQGVIPVQNSPCMCMESKPVPGPEFCIMNQEVLLLFLDLSLIYYRCVCYATAHWKTEYQAILCFTELNLHNLEVSGYWNFFLVLVQMFGIKNCVSLKEAPFSMGFIFAQSEEYC